MTTPVTTHLDRAKVFTSSDAAIDYGHKMVVGFPNWVVRCDGGLWFIRVGTSGLGVPLWYRDTTPRVGDRVRYTGDFLNGLDLGEHRTKAYLAAEMAQGTIIAVDGGLLAVKWDEPSCWTRLSGISTVNRKYVEEVL